MKFVVDCMLGKLAKWLKILGFDAVFFSKIEDNALLEIAKRESRILLTRDTGLIERAKKAKSLFIESETWRTQVEQVLDEFDLWPDVKPNSRCIECNVRIKDLPREKARNLVTPFVFKNADTFALCPDCGRVFWRGTHLKDMESKIDDFLKNRKIPFDEWNNDG
ncbi:MAG: Mut7-C RNAse domain-containing protein [Candidatus Aminicenantes bacterium]